MEIEYKIPVTYTVRVLERHYRLIEVKTNSEEQAIKKAKSLAAGESVDGYYLDDCNLEYSDTYDDSWEAEVSGPPRSHLVIDVGVQCAKRIAEKLSKKGPAYMHKNYLELVEKNVLPMLKANLDKPTTDEIVTAKTAASWTAQSHLESR